MAALRLATRDTILNAKSPWEIYTRNPDIMKQEWQEYLRRYKNADSKKIENFIIWSNADFLYHRGLSELDGSLIEDEYTTVVVDKSGVEHIYHHLFVSEQKICKTITTEEEVVFIGPANFRNYYRNYISKCNFELEVEPELYAEVKNYLPNVIQSFETQDGRLVIVLKKPHPHIYPLSSILKYYGGRLDPRYVASIITRLFKSAIYFDLRGFSHNAITVENIFFAPGRFINPGESTTVEDYRLVAIYGGWFFTTNNYSETTGFPNDKITGLPAKIKSIVPETILRYQYGSYQIDVLAIKQVGRELLGDITGKNLGDIPEAFANWLNSTDVRLNIIREFRNWEGIRDTCFEHKFVEMELPQ